MKSCYPVWEFFEPEQIYAFIYRNRSFLKSIWSLSQVLLVEYANNEQYHSVDLVAVTFTRSLSIENQKQPHQSK